MFNFTKLSPRANGSGIKSRVPPNNTVINRLTNHKKRNVSKISSTAMLILSQTDTKSLHQAIAQVSKPTIHRRVNLLPVEATTVMDVDTVPAQQEIRSPRQETSLRLQKRRPCMPALIVGGLRGKDIDQIDQIHPSRVLTQNLCALRQMGKWEKRTLQQICLSRAQIAAIERRKEREEDEEEERQRVQNRQTPKPLKHGDSVKLWYSDWKAKEWQKKRGVFDQPACY
ncbi:hypothetical protein HDV63DRAFT_410458 [Trichoderma sp. SZMC 28014]